MHGPPEIVIFAKPLCPYCMAAKSLLREKGVAFREVDISRDQALSDEMVQRTGRRTVPQIFIGKRHIGGFDDLSALDRAGELDALLHPLPETAGTMRADATASDHCQ